MIIVVIIFIFLLALNYMCKYAPLFAATKKERVFIVNRIKYPNVFIIK